MSNLNNEALIREIEKLKQENNSLKGIDSSRNSQDKSSTRTSKGLKEVMFQQLDNLMSDNPDYKRANGIAKAVKTIVDVNKTELEFAKFHLDVARSNIDIKEIQKSGTVKTIVMR